MTSSHSPFRFADFPRPSIFLADPKFYKGAGTGKTISVLQSEAVVRATKATGRNPGSIRGLSAKGNLLIEESEHKRRAKG